MKSKLLILVLLALTVKASGQDEEKEFKKLFEGRLVVGLNFSQIKGDAYMGFHKVGLNVGGIVYSHFKTFFGLSLELLYSQKGVRGANVEESYTVGTYFDKYYLNLNYVEACLMAHFNVYIIDAEAGISYARLVSWKEWGEADVPIVIDPKVCWFSPVDVDYVVGMSRRINKHWHVEMRFSYSANAIRPWERVLPRYRDGMNGQYNETASLRLQYIFR